MLTDLIIKNVAIIDQLHLSLHPGLTVLTGETGAGKSIIIDAVSLLMGGRASTDIIRSDADEAVVEALFDLSGATEVCQRLREAGLDNDTELVLRCTISRAGKNRVFINGALSTKGQLAELVANLINIYGQHESQTLLKTENHLYLLDAFGQLSQLREQFAALYIRVTALKVELERLRQGERDVAHRLDLLLFQVDELRKAELRAGEEAELAEQRQVLAHAERLQTTTYGAYEQLYGGDNALVGHLGKIQQALSELSIIDPVLLSTAQALQDAYYQVDDAATTLRDYASRVQADPEQLYQIDERLALLSRLKKKFGSTVEEMVAYQQSIETELASLQTAPEQLVRQEEAYQARQRELMACGEELRRARLAAAEGLQTALATEVHELSMPHARFSVVVEPLTEPRQIGMDRVEFLFSPNPGETVRPLAKIASGGELSRIMLAMKQVLPEHGVPTLIFDEVDTGISGAVSEQVGRKLKRVAADQQVLCITHLPQVAAWADHHLQVAKVITDGRTSTQVMELDDTSRIEELARMLAGSTVTDSARQHAQELLNVKKT